MIHGPYVCIDGYNKAVSDDVSPALTTRSIRSNNYFVSVPTWDDNHNKDLHRIMIAKFIKGQEPQFFDIRKLTPVECFRLMGVPESYIARMTDEESPLSRSACYKLAGNSIVCDVLFYIYKNIWMYDHSDISELGLFDDCEEWNVSLPKHINVVTLCSGYDSQMIAMDMFREYCKKQGHDFTYDLKAWAEFDPESKKPLEEQPAVKAHNVLFPQWKDRNVGDMTKADWSFLANEDIDLLTYSTPCQSISVAGKRAGIKKGSGTRSAVLWSTENAIAVMRPKFLLQENVAALIDKTNFPDFVEWYHTVEKYGYKNYYAVLNAKNYGVPQNRARVYMVSVRKDVCGGAYHFPKPFKLEKHIEDVLLPEVSDNFFLKPESVINFLQNNERNNAISQYQKEPAEYRVIPADLAEQIKHSAYYVTDLRKAMKSEDVSVADAAKKEYESYRNGKRKEIFSKVYALLEEDDKKVEEM